MAHDKRASVTAYVQEELSDARLRAIELQDAIQKALDIIDQSDSKDHIYEVAGHLVDSMPVALVKLIKALDATAYAINGLDSEELKFNIKRDKLDDLDRVLDSVRVRIPRRSVLDKYDV